LLDRVTIGRHIAPRIAATICASIALMFAAGASAAYAGSTTYDCFIAPMDGCWSGHAHTHDYNEASYLGAGDFRFCEGIQRSGIYYSFNCRNSRGTVKGYASDSGDLNLPNRSVTTHDELFNYAPTAHHTIHGYSTW